MSERKTATKRRRGGLGTGTVPRRRAPKPAKAATSASLLALAKSMGPMSEEDAEVFEEALRWARGEGH